jgi:hypothetical protein
MSTQRPAANQRGAAASRNSPPARCAITSSPASRPWRWGSAGTGGGSLAEDRAAASASRRCRSATRG